MAAPYLTADATVSARRAAAVTTSDSAVSDDPTRALYVGGAGNVKVDMVSGGTVTFSNVAAGTLLPIQVTRVYATGTTATLIIGLY
nr:MAG TPA_asm: hypothetical protein [Bacteriophage sp.]